MDPRAEEREKRKVWESKGYLTMEIRPLISKSHWGTWDRNIDVHSIMACVASDCSSLQSLKYSALYHIWCGECSFPPLGLPDQTFTVAYGLPWKVTIGFWLEAKLLSMWYSYLSQKNLLNSFPIESSWHPFWKSKGFNYGLSIWFHWSVCLSLCKYYIVLIAAAAKYVLKSGNVSLPTLFLSRFIWLFWILCISI